MPKVSVVIPCFNLGKYIGEAIDSVLVQTFRDYEVIIVNDGSTDVPTVNLLNNLDKPEIKVIHTENQGLAAARNNGIRAAEGKYILPLDADDKIAPTYLEKAVEVLDKEKNLGIVYCQAYFFDEDTIEWDLPEFQISRMVLDNLIFCSAFFRREDWETVGGYKASMKYGWEDYEFWLSIIELKREVYRIPERLFYYRKRSDSMANVMSRQDLLYSHSEIAKNHPDIFINHTESIFETIYSLKEEVAEKKEKITERDTHIHNLNLEVSRLNEVIKEQNFQLSDRKTLTRLLLQILKKRVRERLGL